MDTTYHWLPHICFVVIGLVVVSKPLYFLIFAVTSYIRLHRFLYDSYIQLDGLFLPMECSPIFYFCDLIDTIHIPYIPYYILHPGSHNCAILCGVFCVPWIYDCDLVLTFLQFLPMVVDLSITELYYLSLIYVNTYPPYTVSATSSIPNSFLWVWVGGSGTFCPGHHDPFNSSGMGCAPHIPSCWSYGLYISTLWPLEIYSTFFPSTMSNSFLSCLWYHLLTPSSDVKKWLPDQICFLCFFCICG